MTNPTPPAIGAHGPGERWPVRGPATLTVALPGRTAAAQMARSQKLAIQNLTHTTVLFANDLPGDDDEHIEQIIGLMGYAWLMVIGEHCPERLKIENNAGYVDGRTITVATDISMVPPSHNGKVRSNAQIVVSFLARFVEFYDHGTPLRHGARGIDPIPEPFRIPVVGLYTIEH